MTQKVLLRKQFGRGEVGGIQLLRSHKMAKVWTPLPPCSVLVNPLLQTFKTLHQTPSTTTTLINIHKYKYI